MGKMHENVDCSGKGLEITGSGQLGTVLSWPQLRSAFLGGRLAAQVPSAGIWGTWRMLLTQEER